MKTLNSFLLVFLLGLFCSCSVHPRSFIKPKTTESMTVEINRAEKSRGLDPLINLSVRGIFMGLGEMLEGSVKTFTNTYSQSVSVKDYYTYDYNKVYKTYDKIVVKKYGDLSEPIKSTLTKQIISDINSGTPKSRGGESVFDKKVILNPEADLSPELSLSGENIFKDKGDIMSFYSVVGIESDPVNSDISRLVLEDLRVFYSKTKVIGKDTFNAVLSVSVEGQWMDTNGNPNRYQLAEQEFKVLNLKYGFDNQIITKVYSPWYMDLPIPESPKEDTFGIVNITVQLKEYDSGKSDHLKNLPDILSENKNSIIIDCSNLIKGFIK